MKRLLFVAVALVGCKKTEGPVIEAARVLGPGAVCVLSPGATYRADCVKNETRFECLSDGTKWVCASLERSQAEHKW